jgi:hypothetical protein
MRILGAARTAASADLPTVKRQSVTVLKANVYCRVLKMGQGTIRGVVTSLTRLCSGQLELVQ